MSAAVHCGPRERAYSPGKHTSFQRLTRLWIVLLPALLLGWALDAGGMHFLPGEHNIYSAPAGQEEVSPGLADRLTPQVFAGNLFFLQTVFFREFWHQRVRCGASRTNSGITFFSPC